MKSYSKTAMAERSKEYQSQASGKIISRPFSETGRKNFDRIFKKRKSVEDHPIIRLPFHLRKVKFDNKNYGVIAIKTSKG
jgi:hypothetical protein